MKFFGAGILGTALLIESLFAGDTVSRVPYGEPLNPPRFEVAVQSGYLLGVFGNPDSYEIGPEFITGRVRWGVNDSDNWTRGYNQFCLTLMAEPIFRGVENHYFGVNFGGRYNFVRPYWRGGSFPSWGRGLRWGVASPGLRGSPRHGFSLNLFSRAGASDP